MEYRIDDKHYVLSYCELKEEYLRFVNMKDEEFLQSVPAAAHLACIICWLKEEGYWSISDVGIIHELIHLMHIPEGNTATLRDIRNLFERSLKLD
jgi:hypothetical protein